jgi:hypothetical protein
MACNRHQGAPLRVCTRLPSDRWAMQVRGTFRQSHRQREGKLARRKPTYSSFQYSFRTPPNVYQFTFVIRPSSKHPRTE